LKERKKKTELGTDKLFISSKTRIWQY